MLALALLVLAASDFAVSLLSAESLLSDTDVDSFAESLIAFVMLVLTESLAEPLSDITVLTLVLKDLLMLVLKLSPSVLLLLVAVLALLLALSLFFSFASLALA